MTEASVTEASVTNHDFLNLPPPPPPPRDLLQTPPSDIFEDTYIQLQDHENLERQASVDAIVRSLDQINITIKNADYNNRKNYCNIWTKRLLGVIVIGGLLVINDYILLKHFVQ